MKSSAITLLIWIAVGATAAAEGTPSGKAASPGASSNSPLSEIRSIVHDLQGLTSKLADLMEQYRSLIEQRPQSEGGSPEAKKADEARLAKWNAAVERLVLRIETAHAAVVEATQRLQQAAKGELPTSLAKDVATARNEAAAERASAEQALAKAKTTQARKSKQPKPAPSTEKPPPPLPDDLDL
jgi:hypothetical protein